MATDEESAVQGPGQRDLDSVRREAKRGNDRLVCMRFSADEFLELAEKVEAAGGAHLPDTCEPTHFTLPVEPDSEKQFRLFTTGCGRETKLVIPYDPRTEVEAPDLSAAGNTIKDLKHSESNTKEALKKKPVKHQGDKGYGFVTVCAVDDNVGEWPRFKNDS